MLRSLPSVLFSSQERIDRRTYWLKDILPILAGLVVVLIVSAVINAATSSTAGARGYLCCT